MGAIAKHCDIESAVVRAFLAGEDMMLICARPEIIRRGYQGLLTVARAGKLPKERLRGSLKRIVATKSIVKPPTDFDADRFQQLSDETSQLNEKLNYKYGDQSNAL
jgi:beta-N-acetylhexosaminidase